MWQRIQTLYLGIGAALSFSMLFCQKADGISFSSYLPYLILLILICLLYFIAFCSFRFRIFQLRTVSLCAILTTALQIWIGVDFFLTRSDVVFRIACVFPLVCVILDILAIRGIYADELLVRSASRLRSAKRNNSKTK